MPKFPTEKPYLRIDAALTEDNLFDSKAHRMQCPVCGFPNVHPVKQSHQDSKDNYEADWSGRGDLYKQHFFAECGCTFAICFGFHKGDCLTWIEVDKAC